MHDTGPHGENALMLGQQALFVGSPYVSVHAHFHGHNLWFCPFLCVVVDHVVHSSGVGAQVLVASEHRIGHCLALAWSRYCHKCGMLVMMTTMSLGLDFQVDFVTSMWQDVFPQSLVLFVDCSGGEDPPLRHPLGNRQDVVVWCMVAPRHQPGSTRIVCSPCSCLENRPPVGRACVSSIQVQA